MVDEVDKVGVVVFDVVGDDAVDNLEVVDGGVDSAIFQL